MIHSPIINKPTVITTASTYASTAPSTSSSKGTRPMNEKNTFQKKNDLFKIDPYNASYLPPSPATPSSKARTVNTSMKNTIASPPTPIATHINTSPPAPIDLYNINFSHNNNTFTLYGDSKKKEPSTAFNGITNTTTTAKSTNINTIGASSKQNTMAPPAPASATTPVSLPYRRSSSPLSYTPPSTPLPANHSNNNSQYHHKIPPLRDQSFSTTTTNTSSSSSGNNSPTTPKTPSAPSSLASTSNPSLHTLAMSKDINELLLDHSHLKPGQNASLLSYDKTIHMYRENVKKANDMNIQCDFAIFLVEAAKRQQDDTAQQSLVLLDSASSNSGTTSTEGDVLPSTDSNNGRLKKAKVHKYSLEAEKLLKQVAMRGHSEGQYYLANMYAAGLLKINNQGDNVGDFDKAFPLFVQSAKKHHPDAAYRAAKCYEDGLGTRKDKAKAFQYYRKAATLNHPGAMYRLGLAEMKGELSLSRNVRDGHKWLKRSAEAATAQYPHALHELALLHEKGLESIIFQDHKYALTLYHEAAALGYAPSAYRLGGCYEFGKLGCTIDPVMSIHYYSMAAEQQHPEACFALTAWYLVGVPKILTPSDEQAYHWALCAARLGLPKAEYAVGYFLEMGIGVPMNDMEAAMAWYQQAAEHGEKRAIQRLQPFEDSQNNRKSKKQHKKQQQHKRNSYSQTFNHPMTPTDNAARPMATTAASAPNITVGNHNAQNATTSQLKKPTMTKRKSFMSLNSRNNSQSSFIQKASTLFKLK